MDNFLGLPFYDECARGFETANLLIEVASEVRSAYAEKHPVYRSKFERLADIFLIRGLKSLQAIMLTAGYGLGQDAGILVRSLLDAAFRLAYVSLDPSKRAEDWWNFHAIKRPKYFQVAVAAGVSFSKEEAEEVQQDYQNAKPQFSSRKGKVRRDWIDRDLRQVVQEIDREFSVGNTFENLYETIYKPMSDFEHFSSTGSNAWVVVDGTNNSRVLDIGPGPQCVAHAVRHGNKAFYIIFYVWNRALNVLPEQEFDSRLQKVLEWFADADSSI